VDGPGASRVRVFAGKNKSRKQINSETGGKRLLKAVQSVRAGSPSHLHRRDGIVSVSWQLLVKIDAPTANNRLVLQWNARRVRALEIDCTAIEAAFNAVSRGVASVEWFHISVWSG
jgi:hypothetical protein